MHQPGLRAAPSRFCLELSEQQALGSTAELEERLAMLEGRGIILAIDDVGREKITIDAVVALKPQLVKIDMSLVRGAGSDRRIKARLLRVVAAMQSLGSQVVAKGIECREDLAVVRELGIEYGQGFWWSPPREWARLAAASTGPVPRAPKG